MHEIGTRQNVLHDTGTRTFWRKRNLRGSGERIQKLHEITKKN